MTVLEPDVDLLWAIFHEEPMVTTISRAAGGWRSLTDEEMKTLQLTTSERKAVLALQELTRRSYPELPAGKLAASGDVGRIYGHRLGGHVNEVMLAVGLDGQNNVLGEVEVAMGGAHGLSITAADILRPLIRMGASAFILVHNHPSGDPKPSTEDLETTAALVACAAVIGIPLVDHVIVAGRGGGFASLLDLGFIEEGTNESRNTHPSV